MPTQIVEPTQVEAAGQPPKIVREYVGRVNSRTEAVSIAHMQSPAGWSEPGQRPQFDEYTVVLKGLLRVEHAAGTMDVKAGQAVIAHAGEWVAIAPRKPEERSISPSVCRLFRRRPCIGMMKKEEKGR